MPIKIFQFPADNTEMESIYNCAYPMIVLSVLLSLSFREPHIVP